MDRRRFWLALTFVVIAALAWRVTFTMLSKGDDTDLTDEGDAIYYSLVADNLSNGDWFVAGFSGLPTADHPPMTVLVLAPVTAIFHDPLSQRLMMSVLGALTVGVVGLWGRTAAGPVVGIVAALIAAANPNLWMNDALIMSESVMGLVVAALLLAGSWMARGPTIGRAAVAGGLCGVAILTRAEAALFLPLMIVPILVLARSVEWRARLGQIGVSTLAVLTVVTPWIAWNNTRFAQPLLLSTNEGATVAGANCNTTYYTDRIGFWDDNCALDGYDDTLDPSENAPVLRRQGVEYARAHLTRLPLVVLAREGRTFGFWRPDQMVEATVGEGRPELASWAGFATFWVLAPASIVGAVLLRRRRVSLVPFGAALLVPIVVSALLSGIPRHRLPLDLATCVLAAVTAVAALTAVRRDRAPAAVS
jgi:4-amino-4-deoxy-L-arabinose transferase-like glycosyltransferase